MVITFTSIPKRVFWISTLILFGCYALTIYAWISNHDFYVNLVSDNGVVEILSLIFSILSALFFGTSYFKHRPNRSYFFLIYSLLVVFTVNGIVITALQFYFIGIPLLTFVVKDLHGLLLRYNIPIPSPATAFLTLLNYLLFTYCLEGFIYNFGSHGQAAMNYGELFQAGTKLVVLYFSVECFRRGTTWLTRADAP
jgi:hypothetical protein